MAKVSNVMATKIALDMVDASTSIRNLTTLVNSATNAWRANVAELRSAGDYAGAAKAKYDGLGDAISAQRDKIEALERKQSEMNDIDKKTADQYMNLRSKLNEYRAEQEKLDTTTQEGEDRYKQLNSQIEAVEKQLNSLDTGTVKSAEQFLRYGQQVDRAKAKLAGLEAQRQRAAQSMDVENSGVLKLNSTMRTQGALAAATAERLRSEGKNYQAMSVEINSLRSRLDTLREIQSREVTLLESTKNRMGETSEAYTKQAARVEEVGTKISETRQKISELNDTMRRTPSGWLGNVSSHLDSIQGKADRVSTTFGKIFGATAAANMFTNALGSIKNQLGDLAKAGFNYDVEQNKMNATWTTLTGSASKATPMIDSINRMSNATGQSVEVVNELEQGFYHLHSSKSQADNMTSSLLNMADAVGLNGQQIQAVEQDMVHGMATGKITQGELNQIGQYFPMIDEVMAKHFHTSVAGMRQMAKAGKVTSKDLQNVFESLGEGKYKAAAENMMNSYFGIFRTIRARAPQLAGDVSAPFMQISNPFLQSVRRWINDKSTDTEFRRLGTQMAKSMNQVISAFGGSHVSAAKLMNGAIRELTQGVRELGNIVATHHAQIASFFSAFKTGSADQAKIFAHVFLDIAKAMLPALNLMARFPKTSAAMITSLLIASRAVRTLQAGIKGIEFIKRVGEAVQSFAQKVRSIPNKKITKVDVNANDANRQVETTNRNIKALPDRKSTELSVQNTDANTKVATTKRNVEQLPSTKRIAVAADTSNAQRNVTAVKTTINGVPKRVEIIGRANTTQAVTNISRVGSASRTAATVSRTSFGIIGTSARIASTGLDLLGGPTGAIMLVAQGFQLLYQHSARFRKFVNDIVAGARQMASRVGHFFGNMANDAGRHINRMAQSARRGWNNITRQTQQATRQEQRAHQQMAQHNQQTANQMWARLRRSWQQGWNNNNRLTRQGVQQQIQQHRTMSSRIAVFNNQMWIRSRQAFTKGWNTLLTSTRNGSRNVNNEFNRMRITVGQRAQQAMAEARNHFRKGYADIKSDTSGWRGDMQNIWDDTRSKIGNIADNLRSDSQSKFSDMHSKLNDITNSGLGQMLNAWHDKLEGIAGVITSSGGHIWNQFYSLLTKLAKPFQDLINGIKDGVNWILDHVGGDGKLSGWTFNAFATGTNGPIDRDQLALLNDAPGPRYQEMVHRAATGETFMLPAKRNMVFPLQKGDEVLDGERSAQLAKTIHMPIPHAGGAVGDFFAGVFDKVGDAVDDAADWVDKALKNVVEFGTELFAHFISSVTPKPTDSLNSGLKLNLPGFYARQLQGWLKKQLEQMQDDNGNAATPAMIRKAAARMGIHDLPDSFVSLLMGVIMTESGNRSIMQSAALHDVNSGVDPAGGILQYTNQTFMHYAMPGHTNRFKPFDELLAFFNNSDWRNSIGYPGYAHGKPDWLHSGPIGSVRMSHFANGGIAVEPSIFGEAGAEMAIPLDTMKSTRAWQLLKQVVDYYAGNQPASNSQSVQTDLSPLERRLDTMMAQNQALIEALDKLIGVTDAVNNPTARYRRTQHDVNMASFQSFT